VRMSRRFFSCSNGKEHPARRIISSVGSIQPDAPSWNWRGAGWVRLPAPAPCVRSSFSAQALARCASFIEG